MRDVRREGGESEVTQSTVHIMGSIVTVPGAVLSCTEESYTEGSCAKRRAGSIVLGD